MQYEPTKLKELMKEIKGMRVPRSRRAHTAESLYQHGFGMEWKHSRLEKGCPLFCTVPEG
eukprot:5584454-Amphidinium_carterae.3